MGVLISIENLWQTGTENTRLRTRVLMLTKPLLNLWDLSKCTPHTNQALLILTLKHYLTLTLTHILSHQLSCYLCTHICALTRMSNGVTIERLSLTASVAILHLQTCPRAQTCPISVCDDML